jgi:hypothetical protein
MLVLLLNVDLLHGQRIPDYLVSERESNVFRVKIEDHLTTRMKLPDIKRYSVKKQVRVRFSVSTGAEVVVDEHGIARIPALASVPGFNLDEEIESVERFRLEPVSPGGRPQGLKREELEKLFETAAAGPAAGGEPEE